MNIKYKHIIFIVFILSTIASLSSFFAQYVLGLNPCPLCIFQRVAVITTALISLILLLLPMRQRLMQWLAAIFISLPVFACLGIAIRQMYIQSLPADQVPVCGSSLTFMMKTLPINDVIQTVLMGSGECAKVERLLGVSLPVWSIIFCVVVLLTVWGGLFLNRNKSSATAY